MPWIRGVSVDPVDQKATIVEKTTVVLRVASEAVAKNIYRLNPEPRTLNLERFQPANGMATNRGSWHSIFHNPHFFPINTFFVAYFQRIESSLWLDARGHMCCRYRRLGSQLRRGSWAAGAEQCKDQDHHSQKKAMAGPVFSPGQTMELLVAPQLQQSFRSRTLGLSTDRWLHLDILPPQHRVLTSSHPQQHIASPQHRSRTTIDPIQRDSHSTNLGKHANMSVYLSPFSKVPCIPPRHTTGIH